ncbi:hypothetical protein [Desulfovibrio sp. JC010]|uniref:hypothetical protein n=1 Tax=Desulfovibrio sp. JC010 TaxID=2593641 RepID=UPI0013D37C3B|nr:hypothetical protein [Desulfovibrio sp. JC010]
MDLNIGMELPRKKGIEDNLKPHSAVNPAKGKHPKYYTGFLSIAVVSYYLINQQLIIFFPPEKHLGRNRSTRPSLDATGDNCEKIYP